MEFLFRLPPPPSFPLAVPAFVLFQDTGSDESDSYYSSDDGDETEGTEDGEAYATCAAHDVGGGGIARPSGGDTRGLLSAGSSGQGAAWAEASWETDKGMSASGGGGGEDDEPM